MLNGHRGKSVKELSSGKYLWTYKNFSRASTISFVDRLPRFLELKREINVFFVSASLFSLNVSYCNIVGLILNFVAIPVLSINDLVNINIGLSVKKDRAWRNLRSKKRWQSAG